MVDVPHRSGGPPVGGRIGPGRKGFGEYRRDVVNNRHSVGLPAETLAEIEAAGIVLPDPDVVRRYRLQRVRDRLRDLDYAGIILYDPVHIRYACDATNMTLWSAHNPCRYLWVGAEGPMILFDFSETAFLAGHNLLVDEVRPATQWMYELAGIEMERYLRRWSSELASVVAEHGSGNRRVAIDRASPDAIHALDQRGLELRNGGEVMEVARSVKSPEEVTLMRAALVAAEHSLEAMRASLEPGMTELDLWAILHAENIRRGGEWIENRFLVSGPRTNPWFHEAAGRVIEDGDLVAFDTDLIGIFGMCVDISRTWIAGSRRPNANQQDVFARAEETICRNIEMVRPGITFRELTFDAWLPDIDEFNSYSNQFHGVGMADEWPMIGLPQTWDRAGYDGVVEPGMVLCVESFVGRRGWGEGVKLEQQVLVTEHGHELLSGYPIGLR
ncbi:MAG: aminopeptidase P family protein [Acidimicrobiia bacterium]|nr:aminopeptidase P family protein [Acidimicrobiia bacterium]